MELTTSDPDKIMDAAYAAERAGRIDEALQHWAEFRAQHPARSTGFRNAIETAKAAGKRQLANQLILEGARQHPDQPALVSLLGQLSPKELEVAERQLSARLVRELRQRRETGDTLLDAALAPTQRRRPSNPALSTALMQVGAIEFLRPGRPEVRVACLRLLRSLKRLSKARERGRAWLADHPDDVPLVLLIAEIVDSSGETAEAHDIVQALRTRVGSDPAIDAALMSLTARLPGADVESVSSRALADHPRSPLVLREWAVIAQRQGDWDEGLRRWEAADRIVPRNKLISTGLSACRLQLAVDRSIDTTDLAKFFGSFSSLGGTMGGCEFGMVQRRYGSKALGLFRWSNIQVDDLVRGLDSNFAGLGTPENTELTISRDKGGLEEYIVQDKAYNSASHTLIYTRDAPMEKVRDQTVRRLGYLRDGLLDQLRSPDKIFVYKFVNTRQTSETLIHRIWAAVRRHGPVKLLCAVLADDDRQRGTIEVLGDGLYVGFLGRMMDRNGIPDDGFDDVGWKGVCSAVLKEDANSKFSEAAAIQTNLSDGIHAF